VVGEETRVGGACGERCRCGRKKNAVARAARGVGVCGRRTLFGTAEAQRQAASVGRCTEP
jgi:hypothetical protein